MVLNGLRAQVMPEAPPKWSSELRQDGWGYEDTEFDIVEGEQIGLKGKRSFPCLPLSSSSLFLSTSPALAPWLPGSLLSDASHPCRYPFSGMVFPNFRPWVEKVTFYFSDRATHSLRFVGR